MTSGAGPTLIGGHFVRGGRKQLILERLSELSANDVDSATLATMAGQNQPAFPSMADLAQQTHPLSAAAAAAAGFALLPHHQQHPHLQATNPHHHHGLISTGSAFRHPHYQPSHPNVTSPHHPSLRRPGVPMSLPATSLHAQFNPSAGPSVNPVHQHLVTQVLQLQQLQQEIAGMKPNCDQPPMSSTPLSPSSSSTTMSPSPSSKASSPASPANTNAPGSGQACKRPAMCSRCISRGLKNPKSDHPPFCECSFCTCRSCKAIAERHEAVASKHHPDKKSKKTSYCSRCEKHGLKNPKKGHPPYCEYRFCICPDCESTAERQDKMAKQISKRRSMMGAPGGQPVNDDAMADEPRAAKRRLSDEERSELFPRFAQYMGSHLDWNYFLMYVTLFRKIGDFKDFDAELVKAEREMVVLASEARDCKVALCINVPIKPIPTRHHHVPPVTSGAPVRVSQLEVAVAGDSGVKDTAGLSFETSRQLLEPSSVTHPLMARRVPP